MPTARPIRPSPLADSGRGKPIHTVPEFEMLPTADLRREWRRIHGVEPPLDLSRDLLIRATAYRLQERREGGLSQTCRRLLSDLAERSRSRPAVKTSPAVTLMAGMRLVRDWGGRTHSVLVREDGFEYLDRRYGSLTEIARRITGSHLSGPRFFGLTKPRPRRCAGSEQLDPDGVAEVASR